MRMSTENQTIVKILTGIIGSVALLITSVAFNNFIDNIEKQSEKLEKIEEYIIKQDSRINEQKQRLDYVERDISQYNSKVDRIIDNLAESRNQLNQIYQSDKKKSNWKHNNRCEAIGKDGSHLLDIVR